jgi:hypothetical protein
VMNTVKDFTNTLWLWKSGTKAREPQVICQTIAGQWRRMYLMPNTGEGRTPLWFRGNFLHVSLARKLLFCTFKFLCILEILPSRKILYTYLNSAYKVLLSSPIEVHGTKKMLNFVDQCYQFDALFIFSLFSSHLYMFWAYQQPNIRM